MRSVLLDIHEEPELAGMRHDCRVDSRHTRQQSSFEGALARELLRAVELDGSLRGRFRDHEQLSVEREGERIREVEVAGQRDLRTETVRGRVELEIADHTTALAS